MTKYDPDFEVFWKLYPFRWSLPSGRWTKVNKGRAQAQWRKLDADTKAFVMSIMPVFLKTIPPQAVPDAFRWLANKCYDDYSLPAPKKPVSKPSEPPVATAKPVSSEQKESMLMKTEWGRKYLQNKRLGD